MNANQLRNSILQQAIQGKLVPQIPSEGTADDLIKQIEAEKKRQIDERNKEKLAKNPRAKLEKHIVPQPINPDDYPFEIPESWRWVRYKDIAISELGKTKNPSQTEGELCEYLCSINVYWDRINLQELKSMLFTDKEKEKFLVQKNDLLICEGGESGRTAIWNSNKIVYYQNALHRVRFYSDIEPRFFLYQMMHYKNSGLLDKHIKGATISHLVSTELNNMIIPLPPLTEQKRIVSKLEELLPIVEEYGKAQAELDKLNAELPDKLKKSVLQQAIQGKLVPQIPSEGTADDFLAQIRKEKEQLVKDGKLKKKDLDVAPIQDDEIPFDIPASWRWVRLLNVCVNIADIDHKMPNKVENGIPYISPLDFYGDNGIDFNNAKKISQSDYDSLSKKCKIKRGDIIFPRYGTIGVIRLVETDIPFLVSYSCATIQNGLSSVDVKYLYYMLLTPHIKENETKKYINKTTQPNVGLQSIKLFLIPLPPLSEQKRIVAKVEELFTMIEKLKA